MVVTNADFRARADTSRDLPWRLWVLTLEGGLFLHGEHPLLTQVKVLLSQTQRVAHQVFFDGVCGFTDSMS
jgi:hypothetical protein